MDVKHVVLVAIPAKDNKHHLKKLGERHEFNFIKSGNSPSLKPISNSNQLIPYNYAFIKH